VIDATDQQMLSLRAFDELCSEQWSGFQVTSLLRKTPDKRPHGICVPLRHVIGDNLKETPLNFLNILPWSPVTTIH
jgi:hypothetical protein